MIEFKENKEYKALLLDGIIQGVSDKENNPLSPYMTFVMKSLRELRPFSDVLFLGGGAMLLPSWAKRELGMNVSVYELDLKIIEVARKEFGADVILNLFNEDALTFDSNAHSFSKHDYIMLDTYPQDPRMYCEAFFNRIKHTLTSKGVFCLNYYGLVDSDYSDIGKTLANVFSNVTMQGLYTSEELIHPSQAVYFCDNKSIETKH